MNSYNHRQARTTAPHFGIQGISATTLVACLLLAGCSLGGKSRLPWSQASVDKQSESTAAAGELAGATPLDGAPKMGRSPAAESPAAPVALASFDRPADRNFAESHGPGLGQVAHAKANDFDQQVLQSDVPVLVDFYADWCKPCKKLAPTLDELAQEMPNARIVKVNIDESPELARRYQVGPIPSLRVFRNGEVAASRVGVPSKQELRTLLTAP